MGSGRQRRSLHVRLAVGTTSLALVALTAPAVQAQTADADNLRQMRQELDALRADEAQAKAAEQARIQRMDALAQQLARASGEPIVQTPPPVEQIPASSPSPRSDDGRKFEIYGFAQADYIQDFNRVNPSWDATLRPSKIPTTTDQFGSDGQSIISVRQSRFGAQAGLPIGGHDLFVKFEFDLFGVGVNEGQTTFRLRHAYGSWGPILAGQTNSVFMDGDTFPNTVDYWGPNGMVFLRNPQIRYTYKSGPHEFAIAIEHPSNDIDPGNIRELIPAEFDNINIQGDEKWPDLTMHYRYDGGWGHVQIAAIVRDVAYETIGTPRNKPSDSRTGWGINVSTNLKTWKKDVLHLSAVYGEGIASYMNDGGTDLAPELRAGVSQPIVAGSLVGDVVPLLGLVAYYDHYWTSQLSTSLGWSMVKVDNTSFQSLDAFKKADYASANLLWTPDSHILMGAEVLWGDREDFSGSNGHDTRIQFSFKYSFSSKDFFQ